MGARPLRRILQSKVEERLSDALLAGEFVDGDHILINVDDDGQVTLKQVERPKPEAQPEAPAVVGA
jgi:ATP-dependent Clp protease ATP-binding subunit ClpC